MIEQRKKVSTRWESRDYGEGKGVPDDVVCPVSTLHRNLEKNNLPDSERRSYGSGAVL